MSSTSSTSSSSTPSALLTPTTVTTTKEVAHDPHKLRTRNGDNSSLSHPLVILTFDDNWKGQIKYVKPILDKYNFTGTFFINCNIIGHIHPPLSVAPVKAGQIMSWQDIAQLKNAGHDIQSHGMNHDTVGKMSQYSLNYEIGQSKQCLLDKGINATVFATPFSGVQNDTITRTVAKYFEMNRAGYGNVMYFRCNHYQDHPQGDCRTYDENGNVTYSNRFNIRGWNHNALDRLFGHDSAKIFPQFVLEVTHPLRTAMQNDSIPVIVYHNVQDTQIDKVDPQWISSTTDVSLFEMEMRYLYEHGFKPLGISSLGYDHSKNIFYVRSHVVSKNITGDNTYVLDAK